MSKLDLSNLKPAKGSNKKRKRVGRGSASGMGKTASRGMNGQKSRSGGTKGPEFEGGQTKWYLRIPKRGFKNFNRVENQIIDLDLLENNFKENEEITVELLYSLGFIDNMKQPVKLLANGNITKPLVIKINKVSKKAKEKVEEAGGKIEVI